MAGGLTAAGLRAKLAALAKNPPSSPVRIGDGGGLHLLVKPGQPGGAWVLRYSFGGRRRDMGLGPYPEVGLAEAREAAEAARRRLRAGADPLAAREAERAEQARMAAAAKAKAVTFREAAAAAAEAKRDGWSNPKHAAQWLATLEQHAFPKIGSMPVAEVGTDDVLRVLRPIWSKIPETASRVRQRIEAVLDTARIRGWRQGSDNPARWRGHLAEELPPPRRVKRVEHRPALPWQEMPAFMAELAKVEGMGAAALRFAILTAARTGEVRGMTWGEVDMEAALWTVPAARMKARRAHRVPLSAAALDVLRAVRPESPRRDALVFPGANGAMLSDMTVSAVIRRMNEAAAGDDPDAPPRWRDHEGRAVVPHGFRSTFRDWAGETRPEGRDVVERALAHTIKDKAEAAYARSDLLEKRRPLMEAWAKWCERPAGGAEVRHLAAERRRRTA